MVVGCTCKTEGSEGGNQCAHSPNGQCLCKIGVTGGDCEKCKDGYFGYGQNEITGCKSKNQSLPSAII